MPRSWSALGHGGYATVVRGHVTGASFPCAVKRVADEHLLSANREIEAFSRIAPHMNIVKYLCSEHVRGETRIALELVEGGDLYSLVISAGCLEEQHARHLFAQMLDAVLHVHAHGVIHRDLKLENWLVERGTLVKLIDFGLCHIQPVSGATHMISSSWVGTKSYCAPEIYAGRGYDYGCDSWSVTVCLFVMLCGFFPYDMASTDDWRFRVGQSAPCVVSSLYRSYDRECTMTHGPRRLIHAGLGRARASVAQRWLEPSLWTGGPKDPHELHELEGRK